VREYFRVVAEEKQRVGLSYDGPVDLEEPLWGIVQALADHFLSASRQATATDAGATPIEFYRVPPSPPATPGASALSALPATSVASATHADPVAWSIRSAASGSTGVAALAYHGSAVASGDFDVSLPVSGRDEIGDLARSLDSMRLALKENFGVLTADRDKLTAIFDGLNDAVMVIDREGLVRFYNSSAADLLETDGSPPGPVRGPVRRAISEGFAAHPALRIGDRAYAMQARSLPDENAVLVVLRDRTDEMRKEFAERDFVSNAAHELRNPLAGISGAIEVLQSGAKDDPVALEHFLERLASDADRMTRLTQSLLTLARVEAIGSGEIEVVDVGKAVEDVREAVEPPPPGIEFVVRAESGLAATADPTLIRQVMIGLVTNAFKNTPPPGRVMLTAVRTGEGEVLIEVSDTGVGIPQAEVDRVFERFYRRTESRSQEGFGLGLAIARRMTDVMGGEMGADSVEGEGSTFWVRLPMAEMKETPVA
jgi:signal transduction histidine kinase